MYTSIVGDQPTIIETFQEVLSFADRLFTLVLIVGSVELYGRTSRLITEHFKPQNSCRNPPVAKHISTNVVQTLVGNSVGDIKWAYNAQDVDKKIHDYIFNNEPFVFYHHGLYSNVRKSADEAVTEICKICREEYLLVVGDDSGIESDIQADIQIVAHLAGLRDIDFQELCQNLQQSSDNCSLKSHFIGTNAVFTLLVLPDVDYLKKELKEEIQHPYVRITVIYSGHGFPDGSWHLYDDCFCASDLMEVLSSIPEPQYDFKLHIYLNCCYGLKFAKEVSDTTLLDAAIKVADANIKESENFPSRLKSWNMQKIIHYAEEPCSDDDTNCHKLLNTCITYQMIKWWEQVKEFIPLNIVVEKISGFILPFAFGPLMLKEYCLS